MNRHEAISLIVESILSHRELMDEFNYARRHEWLDSLDALAFLISPPGRSPRIFYELDPWQEAELKKHLREGSMPTIEWRVGERSIKLTEEETVMEEQLRQELLEGVRSARSNANRIPTSEGTTTATLVESLVALANVLAHVLDALGPSKHAQAVGALGKEEHPSRLGGPEKGLPVGPAPIEGQEGRTAGAKQGGTGWPEVDRAKADPRD